MDDQEDEDGSSTVLITTAEQCALALSHLSAVSSLALGCEGVNLSRTGRLCLIQVAAS